MLTSNTLFLLNSFLLCVLVYTTYILIKDYFCEKEYKLKHANDRSLHFNVARTLFPILFIVMVFRTYALEPFSIPSESMYPQLKIGDYIAVSKTTYNIKFPFTNIGVFDVQAPQRSDVVVFKYPIDKSMFFVKRVVGIPGDTLVWNEVGFFINNKPIAQTLLKETTENQETTYYLRESINGKSYIIRKNTLEDFKYFENTSAYLLLRKASISSDDPKNLSIKIPPDYYFVMGDNRDKSFDSRAWGLVHKDLIVGQAKYIVAHYDKNNSLFNKVQFTRNKGII